MNAPGRQPARGGGLLTLVLFALTLGVLGLLGGLPFYLGPLVAEVGALTSGFARRRRPSRGAVWTFVPALAALTVLTATATIGAATELFAGLSGLAFLLWVADDPTRPVGGGRRAVATIGPVVLAVGLVWSIGLVYGGRTEQVGLGGALIAAGLVLLGLLVVSVSRRPLDDLPPRSPEARGRRARPVRAEEEPFPWELES